MKLFKMFGGSKERKKFIDDNKKLGSKKHSVVYDEYIEHKKANAKQLSETIDTQCNEIESLKVPFDIIDLEDDIKAIPPKV